MSHSKRRVYPAAQFQQFADQTAPGAAVNLPPTQIPQDVQGQRTFTPAQQQLANQIDQTANAVSGISLGSAVSPAAQPQYAPQQYQQPQYAQQPTGRQLNQLYPVDLLTELPPPIRDLSLPPPPLLIPPQKMLVNSEDSNTPPAYMHSTLNVLPKTSALLKKTHLPIGLVIRPYQHLNDDIDPPPLNEDGLIIRCRRCRSYMNPFASFIENGRRWRCNFCRLANDLPGQFDQSLVGGAQNRYERNEVRYGVMEYLAPKEYTVRQPPPSTYCFIIDVSQNAIKNGLLATAARTILENLDSIPNRDERTRVAILCVDHALHYFTIPRDDDEKGRLAMMDVTDLEEPFLPQPHSMVVNLKACRQNIEKLILELPTMFENNLMNNFALGPALRSSFDLIKNIGGKIIVVSATLPNKGIGKLQRRKESGVVNTSKESSQLLSCQDSFYKSFTIECSKAQVTIDCFLASEDYMDVATITSLGRFTGGQTHFYPGFSAANIHDVVKFTKEFSKHLNMDISMETVMRARGSAGLRMKQFHGHFFNRSSDLCAFSTMPRDQSYVFEVQLDDHIVGDYGYIQVAVLLSLNTGQRRIRVITMAIPTTDSIHAIFASVDQIALAEFYNQKAIAKALDSSLQDARNLLTGAVQDILSVYKKDAVVSNTAGGAPLRFCANLRMFPLLMHALTKNMAFRNGVVPSDHRAIALNNLESWPLPYFLKNVYPDVYSLHDMSDNAGLPDPESESSAIVLPDRINASLSLFERYGLYLIDNGSELFLWVGGDAVPELVQDVFGLQDISQIPIGKQDLPIVETSEFNAKIRNIISTVREHDDVITYQSLYIVRGPSLNEPVGHAQARDLATLRMWAASCLVEDKIVNTESYREFLQSIKTKISK